LIKNQATVAWIKYALNQAVLNETDKKTIQWFNLAIDTKNKDDVFEVN